MIKGHFLVEFFTWLTRYGKRFETHRNNKDKKVLSK